MPLALAALWPLARSLLGLLTPALNPMNWPAIGLAVMLAFAVGWFKGDAHGDAQCNAASLQAEIERLKLEADLKDKAEAQEDADAAAILAEKEKREKEDAALIEELKSRPDHCLLGPDAGRV
jgi:hypothetical protein